MSLSNLSGLIELKISKDDPSCYECNAEKADVIIMQRFYFKCQNTVSLNTSIAVI
jgi:hypothetical protein